MIYVIMYTHMICMYDMYLVVYEKIHSFLWEKLLIHGDFKPLFQGISRAIPRLDPDWGFVLLVIRFS